jgi:HSP20 family protein
MTISSEIETKEKEENENYSRMEFNYSSFSRSFTLPENIIESKVSAKYEDGVLKVVIPKSKEQELKDKTTVVKIS